jgi:hypothetical protein
MTWVSAFAGGAALRVRVQSLVAMDPAYTLLFDEMMSPGMVIVYDDPGLTSAAQTAVAVTSDGHVYLMGDSANYDGGDSPRQITVTPITGGTYRLRDVAVAQIGNDTTGARAISDFYAVPTLAFTPGVSPAYGPDPFELPAGAVDIGVRSLSQAFGDDGLGGWTDSYPAVGGTIPNVPDGYYGYIGFIPEANQSAPGFWTDFVKSAENV